MDIACNSESEDINPILIKRGCKEFNIKFKRSPIKKENYEAYKELKKILINPKYDLVHTHTQIASAITRLECNNVKNIEVFYTAH